MSLFLTPTLPKPHEILRIDTVTTILYSLPFFNERCETNFHLETQSVIQHYHVGIKYIYSENKTEQIQHYHVGLKYMNSEK